MTRIISGQAGGLSLDVPKSGTRPTSDKVREALFSQLGHRGYLDGSSVLDLYAGSGALGIEAASRGAARVTLVEKSSAAAEVVRRNVAAVRSAMTHAPEFAVVVSAVSSFLGSGSSSGFGSGSGSAPSPGTAPPSPRAASLSATSQPLSSATALPDVARAVVGKGAPYDLVFLDPPYDLTGDDLAANLEALARPGWLVEDALVVVERSGRSPEPIWPDGWRPDPVRRYGETTLWFAGPAQ